MTNSAASQPPGWYYAQGDPPGTQRYWDGTQWVGGPQAAQDAAPVQQPGTGYQVQYGAGAAVATPPAPLGNRIVAVILDGLVGMIGVLVAIVGFLIGLLLGNAVNDNFGAAVALIFIVVGVILTPVIGFWNYIFRQGKTGQTVGKSQQNIKLVSTTTYQPVGAGQAFIRYLLGGILGLIDVFMVLFDGERRQRLTDKILDLNVVQS